jgi:hypothetical protein
LHSLDLRRRLEIIVSIGVQKQESEPVFQRVCEDFLDTISAFTVPDLLALDFNQDYLDFLGELNEGNCFGLNPQYGLKILALIISQNALRKLVLPILKEEANRVKTSQKAVLKEGATRVSLVKIMTEMLGWNVVLCQVVCANPTALLYWDLLKYLGTHPRSTELVYLIDNTHTENFNPLQLIQKIEREQIKRPWLWEFLIDRKQTEGMTL